MSPEVVKVIAGDFNSSNFRNYVPHCHQYINFATREEKILDHYYCDKKQLQPKQTKAIWFVRPCYEPLNSCLYTKFENL